MKRILSNGMFLLSTAPTGILCSISDGPDQLRILETDRITIEKATSNYS